MRASEFQACPGCGRESEPLDNAPDHVVTQCSKCDFSATTKDVVHAEYLANFRPLPDIRVAAKRIAGRSMLKYSAGRRAA